MKQRAGHLAAARPLARPLAHSRLCVRAAGARAEHLKRGRERWEKAAEKETERSRKLQKGFKGQFSLQKRVMFSGLRTRGLCCIMGVLGMSS